MARYLTTRNLLIIMAGSATGMAICVHAISGFDIGWKSFTWHGLNIGIIGGLFAAWVIFPALVFLALHFQPSRLAARVIKFFGLISFAVYATHFPLGILVQDYAPWAGRLLGPELIRLANETPG